MAVEPPSVCTDDLSDDAMVFYYAKQALSLRGVARSRPDFWRKPGIDPGSLRVAVLARDGRTQTRPGNIFWKQLLFVGDSGDG